MSAQVALMAGMAALSAAASIRAGYDRAKGFGAQGDQLSLQQDDILARSSAVERQTAEKERQRRMAILHLQSLNAADLGSRGIEGGQGTSADIIEQHNLAEGERDVANIRLIGDSEVRRLSFAATNTGLSAAANYAQIGPSITQGWLSAGMRVLGAGVQYYGLPGGGGGGTTTPATSTAPGSGYIA